MKNKSKERKRSLTLKIFSGNTLWQFALALLASLTLACPGNDGGGNGNGGGNGASQFVCPNGTTQSGTATEANVENCAACNSGFHLTDGENDTQLCRRLTLTNVANVDDSDTVPDGVISNALQLSFVGLLTTAVVGDTTYLFVAGQSDDGVSVFSVGSDGALTNVANVNDSDTNVPRAMGVTSELELDGADSVTTAVVGSTTYLFVAGQSDDGVSVFSVGSTGALTNVANVDDSDDIVPAGVDGELELNGARSVTTAVVSGTTYLFVAGNSDDGVSVFSVGSSGTLTNVANVSNDDDDDTLNLNDPQSVTTAVVGGTTYLFVTRRGSGFGAGGEDDGVSVFSVGNGGALTNVANVNDSDTNVPRAMGVTGTLELAGASSVTTAVVGDTTYLFVAGNGDSGFSVFSVGSGGALTNVANVDTTDGVPDGVGGVLYVPILAGTAVIGGTTYLFTIGGPAGVSVFSVGSDGTLTNVANVEDEDTRNAFAPGSGTTAVIGGSTYLFVPRFIGTNGVSVFRVDLAAE